MKLPITVEPHTYEYVQIFDGNGKWLASCKNEHAATIKAALEATVATNDNCNDQPSR